MRCVCFNPLWVTHRYVLEAPPTTTTTLRCTFQWNSPLHFSTVKNWQTLTLNVEFDTNLVPPPPLFFCVLSSTLIVITLFKWQGCQECMPVVHFIQPSYWSYSSYRMWHSSVSKNYFRCLLLCAWRLRKVCSPRIVTPNICQWRQYNRVLNLVIITYFDLLLWVWSILNDLLILM